MGPERSRPLGKRLGDVVLGAVLHAVILLSRLLGIDRASAAGGWVGRRLLAPLMRTNRTVEETLAIAFPDRTGAFRSAIAADMWENLGRVASELAFVDRLDAAELGRRVSIEGAEHLAAAHARGKGVLLVSGHFGNWELVMPVLTRRLGYPLSILVRPPSNPHIAPWIARSRAASGVAEQIDRGADPARRIVAALRRGDAVMMLVDQHVEDGLPVPLFGRDAMTSPAPATIARRFGVPLVPFVMRRRQGATFELEILPEIAVHRTANADRDAFDATCAINAVFEAEIRRNPGHWLWGHRRWRDPTPLSRRAERAIGDLSPPA